MNRSLVARPSRIQLVATLILLTFLLYSFGIYFGSTYAKYDTAHAAEPTLPQAYMELIELSQKEKKGLTFFVKGQTIAGIVVRALGTEAVEVRNQIHSRVVIRLDSVDAVAMN